MDRDKSEFLTIGLVAPPEHVEKQDQFGTLSTKTKFKLSVKTMSDPITRFFPWRYRLDGAGRNSDPSYGQGLTGYSKRCVFTLSKQ